MTSVTPAVASPAEAPSSVGWVPPTAPRGRQAGPARRAGGGAQPRTAEHRLLRLDSPQKGAVEGGGGFPRSRRRRLQTWGRGALALGRGGRVVGIEDANVSRVLARWRDRRLPFHLAAAWHTRGSARQREQSAYWSAGHSRAGRFPRRQRAVARSTGTGASVG